MDLLTYKELDTGPDAPRNPSRGQRAWHWLLSLSPTVVTFMVALSIGLCMVAVQTGWDPMLGLMAFFWFLTFIALVGMVARWVTPGRGRHRMAAS
ncbi:hypothetical protein ACIG0C_09865 [Kitasatospora aureofaciens]|uniref:Uncharacterized protein n=1 Tax=Kitasatospora aureofaciens TaxID=1894 RepID=A0A1E7MX99_KITAU|nr:hypothetical protein [Kitasatospora aureofaciens]QEV02702.1 hypothetical protein CP971_28815 [Streptomyces viridifaciens]ARF81482.1 hypothetical protein B6264_23505 [Kitasatospora aureofaciens]OEV33066.1 hypothetical protein HS99_0014475 [Kitasatospora aureofaciens]UKZ09290.1 hypothetical protein BOQ63_035765 [Streptomyces viridifaciens]GGU55749.1 hypothetical protein GCM10010502_02500 [Kitasatospora aureofaciens]